MLITSSLWLHGPSWLSEGEIEPSLSVDVSEVEELALLCADTFRFENVLEVERWSSFGKAIRVVGWLYRFVKNLRLPGSRTIGALTLTEMEEAKGKLILYTQRQSYFEEMAQLGGRGGVSKSSSIFQLSPVLDQEGYLRLGGRLQCTELSFEEKHPLILPKGHLALLIVEFQHKLLKHAGVAALLTSLRSTYWIVAARQIAKRVTRECVSCRRFDATPCTQPFAPLPKLRVQEAPPFTVVGMDYAGPLFCSDQPKKLYILLFTCAVVRAVHLEICDSLNLQDFLLGFRRFVSRRGFPSVIFSDNAKTFKGADTVLQRHFGTSCPQWRFIVPRSPWWGGWWERLVRSVKVSLRKTIGKSCIRRVDLETTLIEIEACVNSRPLTYVGATVDSGNPLTPSHFLIGKVGGFQPLIDLEQRPVTAKDLGSCETARLIRLNQFWVKWSLDYIRNLPPTLNRSFGRDLELGSMVLIKEDHLPRLQWPLGTIIKLYPGKDGSVRSVELKTSKGDIVRPVQRLYDLEINSNFSSQLNTKSGRRIKPVVRMDL